LKWRNRWDAIICGGALKGRGITPPEGEQKKWDREDERGRPKSEGIASPSHTLGGEENSMHRERRSKMTDSAGDRKISARGKKSGLKQSGGGGATIEKLTAYRCSNEAI